MATSKPAAASGPAKKAPRKTSSTKKTTGTSSKAKPVVLDPPQQARPAQKKINKPQTIDATAIEVNPSSSPPPQPRDSAPKPVDKPSPEAGKKTGTSPALVFSGFVLGGLAAGAIGYGIAVKTAPLPDVIRAEPTPVSAEVMSRLKQLESRLAAAENPLDTADFDALSASVLALKSTLEKDRKAVASRLDAAESQLAKLQTSNNGSTENAGLASSDMIAAINLELDQIQAQISDQAAQIRDFSARIETVAQQAGALLSAANKKITSLSITTEEAANTLDLSVTTERLRTAIETGKPYAALLKSIKSASNINIPATLQINAQNGVATLSKLQRDFPVAARQALKASVQANAGDGLRSQVSAYLKSQIGARSLEEKPGDDPDAVLSRAEASLGRGQLTQTIDLIQQLPPEGVAKMNGWLASANRILAVKSALIEIDKSLENKN